MSFSGQVVKGKGLGRKLGFPTINLLAPEMDFGVFLCEVELNGCSYKGVMHFGPDRDVCEVHLFDFDEDVYGESVTVTVYDKIRDTRKFDNLEDLTKQIEKDVEIAKKIDS